MKRTKMIATVSLLGLGLMASALRAADGNATNPAPGNSSLSAADMKARRQQYQQAYAKYLAEQKALQDRLAKLKQAKAKDKEALRQKLQAQYQALRDAERALHEQMRLEVDKLRQQFKNNRDRVINNARSQGQNNRHRGGR